MMSKPHISTLGNRFYKFISRFYAWIWDGFLGENPTDIFSKLYTLLLRMAGTKIGHNSIVHHRVHVWNPENIVIGDEVFIPASVDMAGMGVISIGNRCLIGASVRFITNHHPLDENLPREQILAGTQSNIEVSDNVWIMNNVLLVAGKKGLKIGQNSWIAAGSIVTQDVEPNSLYAGVPARKIKDLFYEKA